LGPGRVGGVRGLAWLGFSFDIRKVLSRQESGKRGKQFWAHSGFPLLKERRGLEVVGSRLRMGKQSGRRGIDKGRIPKE
jgi:hypothetical protein